MANVLNTDKQIAVIAAFAEGSSIRAIERLSPLNAVRAFIVQEFRNAEA